MGEVGKVEHLDCRRLYGGDLRHVLKHAECRAEREEQQVDDADGVRHASKALAEDLGGIVENERRQKIDDRLVDTVEDTNKACVF